MTPHYLDMCGERRIAALYVETGGCYAGLPGVDPWDRARDARLYAGPFPVVAHPPCERWGRYATGSPRQPKSRRVGEDGGCFAAALLAVRNYGGVLEHPAYSRAWDHFGVAKPPASGWGKADRFGGWSCAVDQGHYGHISRKSTWLYAVGVDLPPLNWTRSAWEPDPAEVERIGFRAAQRNGALSKPGLRNRASLRLATPAPFRDLLISIARSTAPSVSAVTLKQEDAG